MDTEGKHFRSEEENPARRLFLKRSLAAATGLIGFKLFEATGNQKSNNAYGSSPYGGAKS